MNLDELVQYLSINLSLPKTQAQKIINCIEAGIIEGLELDGTAKLGIGSFVVKQRKARMGRNPRTGESVQIPARKAVGFKIGKKLKEAIK